MINYFTHYILGQKTTGMLLPSSDDLISLMIRQANLLNKKTIVELGTGTGNITYQILKEKNQDAVFFGLEINDYFIKKTKKKCPNAKIYHNSAKNIKNYLLKNKLKSCDCVISGLPWTYFSYSSQKRIVSNISSSLSEGGSFITYAYFHGLVLPSARRFRKLLYKNFSSVAISKIIWSNFPPSIVYHAKK